MPSVELQGVIMHVANLERAVDFYAKLLDFRVAEQTSNTVFLASQSETSTIVLSERRAEHFTDRTVQAIVWRTPTLVALDLVERRLEGLKAAAHKRTVAGDGLTLLSTRDPDGQRLLFIHTERVGDLPTNIPPEVYWY